jgi:hypothetical protein
MGVPILKFSRFQLRNLETKWHLDAGPMARNIKYYKGESGGFPQARAAVGLVIMRLLVACLYTKGVLVTH